MGIGFRASDGRIRQLSAREFQRIFGAAYAPRLRVQRDMPRSFLDLCAREGPRLERGIAPRLLRTYKRQIAAGHVAPSYIAKVDDKIGYGLYAARELRPGDMAGEYTGSLTADWVSPVKKARDFNPYLFKYPFETPYAIDAEGCGNEIRFVNHSLKNKNSRRRYVLESSMLHVIYVVEEVIPMGGQILRDYGKSYWQNAPAAAIVCR